MIRPGVRAVCERRMLLGESPVWCREERSLYFVDIYGATLNRLDVHSGDLRVWHFDEPVSALALRENGRGAVVALRGGLALFDFTTGDAEPIGALESHPSGNRLNDGRCDARGRFWVGSMSEHDASPVGQLYRLDADLRVHRVLDGIVTPNSIAFGPDGRRMYLADSARGYIDSFSYDLESATLSDRQRFATVTNGVPDGSAVDADGRLWNAVWDGWAVVCYASDGSVAETIELPVQRPTMCAFGGDDLQTLYITTASYGLSATDLAMQPLAGKLLSIEVGVKGLPEPRFAG